MPSTQLQDSSPVSPSDQSSASAKLRSLSFAEIENYQAPENATTTLFLREPYLRAAINAEENAIPENNDYRIEDLSDEDMELPIDFI